jgi:hypothetical protein
MGGDRDEPQSQLGDGRVEARSFEGVDHLVEVVEPGQPEFRGGGSVQADIKALPACTPITAK